MMRAAVASSVTPPNIMAPRHNGDTFSPLCPRLRYSMLPCSRTRRLWLFAADLHGREPLVEARRIAERFAHGIAELLDMDRQCGVILGDRNVAGLLKHV